jgi:hypothetical protein
MIRRASQFGEVEVAKLLLADPRVDISGLPHPSFPEIFALFLLRRSFRLLLKTTEQPLLTSFPNLHSLVDDIDKFESQRKALLEHHLVPDLSNMCLEYAPDFFCHLDVKVSSLVDSNSDNRFPRFSLSTLSSL